MRQNLFLKIVQMRDVPYILCKIPSYLWYKILWNIPNLLPPLFEPDTRDAVTIPYFVCTVIRTKWPEYLHFPIFLSFL